MSSNEVITRVQPYLPKGDWTVVLRLAGDLDTPLKPEIYDVLRAAVPETARPQ